MRARKIVAVFIALLAVASVAIAAFFGAMVLIERQRVQDADPAFKPLVPLGVEVLCNPLPFRRHCWYVVTFPQQSKLSDANTADLVCLSRCPKISCGAGVSPARCSRDGRTTKLQSYSWTAT